MRKTAVFLLLLTSLLGFAAPKVEVYYFHYTRRCTTCVAVEQQSQKFVQELYGKQLKEGRIIFKGVNLDDKSNAALAQKCKADGQALLVISGGKRIDLTEQGFMYATYKTEKLKEALKKAIDPLI